MKKCFSLLLALMLMIGVMPAVLAEEPVTLRIAYHADTYQLDENGNDKLALIYDDFTKEYPNIKVEITYIANSDWADYTTKIQSMFVSGDAPDLMYCPGETENVFFTNKMVRPLTPFLEKNPQWQEDYEANVASSLRAVAMHDGEYYGFVHLWENDVMWLNNQVFKAAGATIPEGGKWTWDEFEAACDLIEKNTDAYAFFIPDSYYVNGGWLYSFGTGYLNEDYSAITFDSDASKELMQFYVDGVNKGWTSADWTNLDPYAEFINYRLAMYSAGRWPMTSYAKESFTDVSVVYLPTKYSDLQTCAWASMQVCTGTEHYDEAALLAAWTGSKSFCYRFSNEVNSNIPSRLDVNTPDNYLFEFDGMDLFYEAYKNTKGLQNPVYFADLETIWRACVTSVISGSKDVETAVNDAAAEMRMVAGM